MTSAEDEIRSEFAKLENLERRQAALRGLAESLVTTRRSHLEPDRMAELSALNPGHDQKKLTRLAILADIHDEDDAATGALEPGEDCPDCHGTGVVWFDVDTPGPPHYCGGCSGYPGITHEPACGTEPCPRGCEPKEAIR